MATVGWHVASVGVMRTALLAGVLKEGNSVVTTKLVMAELKEASFGLRMESVAVGRIVMKTVVMKAETVAETTKWEIVDLQWEIVVERRVRKVVHLSDGVHENKLIAGLDLKLAAVELYAVLVAESTVAAEKLRMDVGGNWSGPVDPLVIAETCGSVGCLLRFLSVHDQTIGDGNAALHGDDVETSTVGCSKLLLQWHLPSCRPLLMQPAGHVWLKASPVLSLWSRYGYNRYHGLQRCYISTSSSKHKHS